LIFPKKIFIILFIFNYYSMNSSTTLIPCVKCIEGDGSFFRLENTKLAGYCIKCFPKIIQHKFASSLGRNRVFKVFYFKFLGKFIRP
jgi:hypothetical protein